MLHLLRCNNSCPHRTTHSNDLLIISRYTSSSLAFAMNSTDLINVGHAKALVMQTSQRLGILRKSWQVFHDRLFLGRCFRGFVLAVLEYSSAVWCSAADTHLKLLDRVVSGASFLAGVCLSVTLHIVHLWQYYLCCTRSGVIRCTLFMVLFLWRMCRCRLHAAQ